MDCVNVRIMDSISQENATTVLLLQTVTPYNFSNTSIETLMELQIMPIIHYGAQNQLILKG